MGKITKCTGCRKNADLIFVLSTDPHQGGNLIYSGGQTGTIDSQGHIEEDPIPNYNKQVPVRYEYLTVMDAQTGKDLWSASQRWGGLLTGIDSVENTWSRNFKNKRRLLKGSRA